MSLNVPLKLLEINIVSAQDLPPVSKMLRTFVVAWIQPDHKLSTRIDHQGHTNPTWNYKLVFRVDDRFLRSEAAAINIEIYNVAWLRDLPIGTTRLLINHLSPPLMLNSPVMRSVGLHIRRSTGHLQGILNVGINILDNSSSTMMPLGSELSILSLSTERSHNILENQSVQEYSYVEDNWEKEAAKSEQEDSGTEKQSSTIYGIRPYDEDRNMSTESSTLSDKLSRLEIQSKSVATKESFLSVMHPLPSEVAAKLKKSLYSTAGDDFGSSIFDNWTEGGDGSNVSISKGIPQHMNVVQIPLANDHEKQKVRPKRRRHSNEGGSLFSCFGKGFEFTFVCGSKNMKNNRSKSHRPQKFHFQHSDDDVHRFFI